MSLLFSLICPSNRPEMVDSNVRAFLKKQTNFSYELIVVNTARKKYHSGAQALNDGATRAKGRYLIFLHHDIVIDNPRFLDEMSAMVVGRQFLIAGVAGCVRGRNAYRKQMLTNIVHGKGRMTPDNALPIVVPTPCATLDECLFVIPRDVWRRRPLSDFYPSWHLYAVEYSLWANCEMGGACLVLPLRLWHLSSGVSFDESYYRALMALRKLYRNSFRVLYTPLGAWPTGWFLVRLRILFNRIKRFAMVLRRWRWT